MDSALEHPADIAQLREDCARLVAEIDTLSRERATLREQLQLQDQRLAVAEKSAQLFTQCTELLHSGKSGELLVQRLLHVAVNFMHAERGFIALRRAKEDLHIYSLPNIGQEIYLSERSTCQGILERVLSSGAMILTTDTQHDFRSILCCPLVARGRIIGAMYLDTRIQADVAPLNDPALLRPFLYFAASIIDQTTQLTQGHERVLQATTRDVLHMKLLEITAGGVITLNAKGIITSVNAPILATFAVPTAKLLGSAYHVLDGYAPGIADAIDAALALEIHASFVISIRGARQPIHYLQCRMLRIDEENMALVVNPLHATLMLEQQFARKLSPSSFAALINRPQPISLHEQRTVASVMAIKFRGFSLAASKLQPHQAVVLLNAYLEHCVRVLFEHGGKIEYIQHDGLVAVFGSPPLNALKTNSIIARAVQAGLAMQAHRETSPQLPHDPISPAIGLATGSVIVGFIGSRQELDFRAIGDIVELAEHLQAKAEAGSILCDDVTYKAVKNTYNSESRIAGLRGREERFLVHKILGVKDIP